MTNSEYDATENTSFELIWHAGNSKSCSMEALAAANANDYKMVEVKLNEADDELKTAHQIQTKMLHGFANGQRVDVNVLMVHAQDHLNGAMLTNDFVKQMIIMTKEIQELKEKIRNENICI